MIPIPEDKKVPLTAAHMQSRVEFGYQGHIEKRGVPSWTELTIVVLERFEDLDYERVVSEFNMLHQETTVNADLEKFEELEAHMLIVHKNLDETFFMMKFISGLKEEIKGKTNQYQKSNQSKPTYKPPNKYQSYKPSFKPFIIGKDDNPHPRRFLTEAERTLRVNGKVNGKEIHMLIDSGIIHCFVDEKMAQVLGCKLEPTTPMMVRIEDGGRVLSKFFCPNFCWEIQSHEFSHPVRVLKLGGYDCILGCDWLSANNPIGLDFHLLQVTITQVGKKVILKALTEKANLRTLSVYSLNRLLRKGHSGVKGELYATKRAATQDEKDPKLLELPHQFKDISGTKNLTS
ncbi:UNVERIFIED_CONTAM: hypothetical protein Scaly_1056200 [Sesamum calycinum]|uniref:Uncharacterized protein n=1 Tax=Sesamum calycinum TaxID=2727403 RepID=A0AAW2QKM6_9LAMI